MRAILLAGIAGLMTAGAVAVAQPQVGPYWEPTETYMQRQLHGYPRAYFMNQWGGLNDCRRAATDTEVEWCAGELPASSSANPARFDCRKAEVDAEYRYCRKPFPHRVPAR
jgi:hypothetical protein